MNENYEKEEWGAWKIVSDMLDKPDENGIYPTSECYQKLYEFVCNQKQQLLESLEEELKLKSVIELFPDADVNFANETLAIQVIEKDRYNNALNEVKALIQSKKDQLNNC